MSNEYKDWRNDRLETYENLFRKIAIHAFSQKDLTNFIDNYKNKSWASLNHNEREMLKQLSLYNEYVLKLIESWDGDVKEYRGEFEDIKKELKRIGVEYRVIDLEYSEIGNLIFSIIFEKNLSIHDLNKILYTYRDAVIYRYYYDIPYDTIVELSKFLGVSKDFLIRHSSDPSKYYKEKGLDNTDEVIYEDVIEEKLAKDRISYPK